MSVLRGISVLDCSIAMAGPFAAQRLGDLGADVIKIEPVTGEWQRHVSAGNAMGNEVNTSFLSLNRNKRSLAVNLKAPGGREVVPAPRRARRRLPAELPPRRRRAPGRRLRDASARQPGPGLRLDLRLRRHRPYASPARPGHAAAGADGLDVLHRPRRRRPRAGRPLPGRRDHGLRGLRGRAGRTAAPRAHRRGPARRGQHARRAWSRCRCRSCPCSRSAACRRSAAPSRAATSTSSRPTASSRPPTATSRWPSPTSTSCPPARRCPCSAELADDAFANADEITRLTAAGLRRKPTADWLAILDEHGIWCGPVQGYAELARRSAGRAQRHLRGVRAPDRGRS